MRSLLKTITRKFTFRGKIKDASLIESINVDGVSASFNPTNLNPEFSTQIKIADKSKISITVRDIYGNENIQVFALNRSAATAGIDNPMETPGWYLLKTVSIPASQALKVLRRT